MDLLFSDEEGIGLSILRSEVGNGLNMPTIHPDKDTWILLLSARTMGYESS